MAEWPKATATQKVCSSSPLAYQQLALRHLPDVDSLIPRQEMDAFKARLEDVFGSCPGDIQDGGYRDQGAWLTSAAFELVGSYRCGLEYSPSIEVLVYSE